MKGVGDEKKNEDVKVENMSTARGVKITARKISHTKRQ